LQQSRSAQLPSVEGASSPHGASDRRLSIGPRRPRQASADLSSTAANRLNAALGM
jgi:hypothetical protein